MKCIFHHQLLHLAHSFLKKMKRWIHPYPFISTGTVSREISHETGLLQGFKILDRLEDGILLERINDLLINR